MPVLVTAPQTFLGRRTTLRLLEEGGEVRVYGGGDLLAVRAAGAFVATGDPDDEGRLEAALEQVHTLIHVDTDVATADPEAIVAAAQVAARAAAGAGVRRVIASSIVGARVDASDPLRRACSQVEAAIAAVPCPSVAVRFGLIVTPAIEDALVAGGVPRELEDVEVAPVRPADAVELLAGVDRLRGRATAGHLVVLADGPERMPLGELATRLGAQRPGRGGLVGRRLPDEAALGRSAATLAGPWHDEDPTLVDGWQLTEVVPGRVERLA